jgi:hypothetical protein
VVPVPPAAPAGVPVPPAGAPAPPVAAVPAARPAPPGCPAPRRRCHPDAPGCRPWRHRRHRHHAAPSSGRRCPREPPRRGGEGHLRAPSGRRYRRRGEGRLPAPSGRRCRRGGKGRLPAPCGRCHLGPSGRRCRGQPGCRRRCGGYRRPPGVAGGRPAAGRRLESCGDPTAAARRSGRDRTSPGGGRNGVAACLRHPSRRILPHRAASLHVTACGLQERRSAAASRRVSAATYSPTQLPGQYHRRWRA